MRYLSERYKGTLHNPDLTLDDAIVCVRQPTGGVTQVAGSAPIKTEGSATTSSSVASNYDAVTKPDVYDAETKDDDDIVELKIKSNNTVIAENYAQAKAAGQVISLTSGTYSQTTVTSIRSTFDSVSDSLTAMRSSVKRKEREVTVQASSLMVSFDATRMVLTRDSNGEKIFVTAPGEVPDGRRVQVSMHPFAQGKISRIHQ